MTAGLRPATFGLMPRKPRNWKPGGTYHVFSRGSNRQALFLTKADRIDFLAYAEMVVQRYELECLGYVLMTNHFHFLLRTPSAPGPRSALSEAMRDLNGTHARRFNRRHGRGAHAFRNRFGAVHEETTEQILATARYIVRNPVAAGLCLHPAEWPWSSYAATAGLRPPPPILSVGRILALFGAEPTLARARFVDFVEAGAGNELRPAA